MGEQTIQSRDIDISKVFQDFYAVPDYQREYVWEAAEVEQLLGDINEEFSCAAPDNVSEYFIGSIVVCPTRAGVLEFGAFGDPLVAERLGNLVLVEKSINAALGNRRYSEKAPVYRESQLLLTRALSKRPKVGANTKIDAAVVNLEPFEVWNEAAVARRQEQLASLARSVWNLP